MTAVPDRREVSEVRRTSRPAAYPELTPGFRDTLTRTPKDSYGWYRGLITAHRARTEEPAR